MPPRSRRRFLAEISVACSAPWIRIPPAADLVIRGGTLIDGSGARGKPADVAVAAGRVTQIGRRIRSTARTEIDARGLVVAPGFIDIHSHADSGLRADPRAESLIRQGVTTVVVGADGSYRFPVRELFDEIRELEPAVHVASMVGLGRIRQHVIGHDDRPATPDELARMAALVEDDLAAGAAGASAGLEYTPGAFASRDELIALCRPLARRGLPFAPHMRNEDDRLLDAVEEAVAVARGARCPLHISHLKTLGSRNWWKLDQVFGIIADATASGLSVTFDRYPYLAYSTGLTSLFPVAERDGGTAAFVERLRDDATRERLASAVRAKVEMLGGWDRVMVSNVSRPADRDLEGKRISELAENGRKAYDIVVELLIRNGGGVGMVGFGMSEPNLDRLLAHPAAMVASDGGALAVEGAARRGHPHPRSLGTFARVLGHFVRERRVLQLEDAIRRMTSMPAARAGLHDRGLVRVGRPADLVVFDPARIADRATFQAPFAYADGVRAVLVNGRLALQYGERLPERAGTALRPSRRAAPADAR